MTYLFLTVRNEKLQDRLFITSIPYTTLISLYILFYNSKVLVIHIQNKFKSFKLKNKFWSEMKGGSQDQGSTHTSLNKHIGINLISSISEA